MMSPGVIYPQEVQALHACQLHGRFGRFVLQSPSLAGRQDMHVSNGTMDYSLLAQPCTLVWPAATPKAFDFQRGFSDQYLYSSPHMQRNLDKVKFSRPRVEGCLWVTAGWQFESNCHASSRVRIAVEVHAVAQKAPHSAHLLIGQEV